MKLTRAAGNILIVEDDQPKLRAVTALLRDIGVGDSSISYAGSLSSAIGKLSSQDISLAIIDMSIPTFDFAVDSSGGGKPQGYGGFDILRFIKTESFGTNSVVLTQYEEFPSESSGLVKKLDDLERDLAEELGPEFLGVLRYVSEQEDWRIKLKNIVSRILLDLEVDR